MMSVQGEADYLRRSMLPRSRVSRQALQQRRAAASIRQVYSREKQRRTRRRHSRGTERRVAKLGTVVAIFSPKVVSDAPTIAVNLAVVAPPS